MNTLNKIIIFVRILLCSIVAVLPARRHFWPERRTDDDLFSLVITDKFTFTCGFYNLERMG